MKEYINFDVMMKGRFVCTMRFPHCRLFKFDMKELLKFVFTKRPSLKYEKKIELYMEDGSVFEVEPLLLFNNDRVKIYSA